VHDQATDPALVLQADKALANIRQWRAHRTGR
jgi:hypothetical protein